MLSEILERVSNLDEEGKKVVEAALEQTKDLAWIPNPGPQTEAYFCEADELFYGGEAGGGKSALLVGLSQTQHEKSLILRRFRDDAKSLAEDELIGNIYNGDRDGWNGQDLILRKDIHVTQFGGCQSEDDKQRYKGKPHDLKGFDEITDFSESQYRFIIGWNRSVNSDQRCRVVCTGNPPTNADGLWVITYWEAWLDPDHPNPAKPGELRWYTTDEDGNDIEVDGPGPHLIGGIEQVARSRTFIRAGLADNPDLAEDGKYAAVLSSFPKELRDAYRDGRFDRGIKDNPWQMIPTDWVRAAQARWTPKPPDGVPMCAIGVDVAQGGDDNNCITHRHDYWFSEAKKIPGKETPLGTDVAGIVIAGRRDGAKVILDCGGGYGGSAYKSFTDNDIPVRAYKGSMATKGRAKNINIPFKNVRTEAYWKLKEALDPDQPGGSDIQLPPGRDVIADLSIRYEIRNNVIVAEEKDKICARLGRSTDDGDSIVMAHYDGNFGSNVKGSWKQGQNVNVVVHKRRRL